MYTKYLILLFKTKKKLINGMFQKLIKHLICDIEEKEILKGLKYDHFCSSRRETFSYKKNFCSI